MIINPYRFSTTGDPYFSSVVLLAHMNGTNGGTTFTDNSSAARALTANGNAQTSTAQSKFNGSSGLFDGNADYITAADSAAWDFGTGDFTIEMWVRITGGDPPSPRSVLSSGAVNSIASFWTIEGTAAGKLAFFNSAYSTSAALLTSTSSWNDTWRFVAIVRSGNDWNFYVDGTSEANATSSAACNSDGQLVIGSGWYAPLSRGITGNLAEVRITKGVARYTGNFTSPSAAFPDS